MKYEIKTASPLTRGKRLHNLNLDLTPEWQEIPEITNEVLLLVRWGEAVYREKKEIITPKKNPVKPVITKPIVSDLLTEEQNLVINNLLEKETIKPKKEVKKNTPKRKRKK